MAARRAYRQGDQLWLDHLKKHSRFFLLASLVCGAVTGVGIWSTIGLTSPQATSLLMRTFVWGWAIESCFFLIEVAAILLYSNGWNQVSPRFQQTLA